MKHYINLITTLLLFCGASSAFAQKISVSSTSIDFGQVYVGGSNEKQLTISNGGAANLVGSASSNSGDFNVSNSSFNIAPGGSHTVTIKFAPNSGGNKSATLSIQHNATNVGSPATIPMAGEALDRRDFDGNPGDIDFGDVLVGETGQKTFQLKAASNNSDNIQGTVATNTSGFSVVSGGNFDIAPGGSHTVTVQFAPGSEGNKNGTLRIGHDATNTSSPTDLNMTGTGIHMRNMELSHTNLDFGTLIPVGSTAVLTLIVSNDNSSTTNLTGTFSVDGAVFRNATGNTSFDIAPGGSHSINVTFSPTSGSSESGTLRVEHNATNTSSPEEVPLSGTGIQTVVNMEVSPASLDLGGVTVGESHYAWFTISNDANSTENLTGTVDDNREEFRILTGSSFDIAPGSSHDVQVLFEPTSTGTKSGKVRIEHNATNTSSPFDLSMEGVGLEATAYPFFNTDFSGINFGDVEPGGSQMGTLLIQNLNPDVNFAGVQWDNLQGSVSIVDSDDNNGTFTIIGGAEFDIPAGTAHEVAVRFDAGQMPGPENASLGFIHNGRNTAPQVYIGIDANITAGSLISFDKTDLGFSVVRIGETRQEVLTIFNDAGASANLTGTVTENDDEYSIVSGSSFDIAPSGSHEVTVQLAPTSIGSKNGALNIAHNAANETSPVEILMAGVGLGAMMTVGGDPLVFDSVEVGLSKDIIMHIHNQEGSNTNLTGTVSLDSPDFSVLNGSFNLSRNETQEVTIRFAPTSAGNKTAVLSIEHDAINIASPIDNVPLSGIGFVQETDASLDLSASELDFGDVPLGSAKVLDLVITNRPNDGSTPEKIDQTSSNLRGRLSIVGPDARKNQFEILDSNAFDIPFGQDHTVRIRFGGEVQGITNAALLIQHNAGNKPTPTDVPMTVNVTPPEILMGIDKTELDFGLAALGESEIATITITNLYGTHTPNREGKVNGPFNLVGTVSESSDDFEIIDGATFDIAPITGAQPGHEAETSETQQLGHTVTIRFRPQAAGDRTALLFIEHNAINYSSPTEIPMEGIGSQPNNIDISVDKTEINFGNVLSGETTQEVLTVFNDAASTGNLTGSVAFKNSALTEGSSMNISGASFNIAPGASHQATLTFEAGEAGNNTASLEVTHNATNINSPAEIPVGGQSVATSVYLSVNKTGLNFGNVKIGNSRMKTLIISNAAASTDNLTGSVSDDGSDFDVSDDSFDIAPGGNHEVTVTFTPNSADTKTATLAIAHNASNQSSPAEIPMQGEGTNQDIDMSVDKIQLDFGDVAVGESAQQVVTISNAPGSAANLTGEVSEDSDVFNVTDGSFDISPGGSHEVTITFNADTLGIQSALLEIMHNATNTNSPAELPMQGRGAGVSMSLDAFEFNFGEILPNSSAQDTLTIHNSTKSIAALTGSVSNSTAEFEITDGSFDIAPGDSHKVAIAFTPDSEGAKADTLEIVHNALNLSSPVAVPLAGKSAATIIAMRMDTSVVDFGNVFVGESKSKTLTIINAANSTENLTGVISENSGNFDVTGSSFDIAPGDTHEMTVTFVPGSMGSKSALMEIAHNATNLASPLEIPLQGEGVTEIAAIIEMTFDTTLVDLGEARIDSTVTDTLTIYNAALSTQHLVGTFTENSGYFDVADSTFSIAPGDSYKVAIAFTPGFNGSYIDTLWITHNATNLDSVAKIMMLGEGEETVTGVSEKAIIVTTFQLHQNYPNPFNPSTTIAYSLENTGQVELHIYDILGRKIRELISERKTAGAYTVSWNGRNDAGAQVASGSYFYKLKVDGSQLTGKMVLIK